MLLCCTERSAPPELSVEGVDRPRTLTAPGLLPQRDRDQGPGPREPAGRRPSAGLPARSSLLCASLCEKTAMESTRKQLPAHSLWSQVRNVTRMSQSRPKGSSLPSGPHTRCGVSNLSFCAGRGRRQTQDRGTDAPLQNSPAEGPLPCLEPAGLFLDKPLPSILEIQVAEGVATKNQAI